MKERSLDIENELERLRWKHELKCEEMKIQVDKLQILDVKI